MPSKPHYASKATAFSDLIANRPYLATQMQTILFYDMAALLEDMRDSLLALRSGNVMLEGYNVEGKPKPFPLQFLRQQVTLAPGKSAYAWQFDDIMVGTVATIRYMGVKWFPNSTITLEIDGTETEDIQRTIGDISNPIGNPERLVIPYTALDSIKFFAENNDPTITNVFEVYCAGEIWRIVPNPKD